MKLYSMTATFGKLEHETLTLKPGLNIITAPNEWGKSTWCAFLTAMLYGLDTRAKSTKTVLADKDRYSPWSGSPMSGRIDLNWNGRDITIERSSKGRIPLGTFRAYETQTGLTVPELTAANCGQTLLGVEQSVFRRTAFIRFSDLPVTDDDALRTRLNALVTTGDDSGDAAKLEKGLKELKNKIRYNRTGLLPEAEAAHNDLEDRLDMLRTVSGQYNALFTKVQNTQTTVSALKNHRDAIAYAEAQAHAKAVAEARQAFESAQHALDELGPDCAALPPYPEAAEKAAALEALQARRDELDMALNALPPAPVAPDFPVFQNMSCEEAIAMAKKDAALFRRRMGIYWLLFLVLGVLFAAGSVHFFLRQSILFIPTLIVALACLFLGIYRLSTRRSVRTFYEQRYHSLDPVQWQADAQSYSDQTAAYAKANTDYAIAKAALQVRASNLRMDKDALCGEDTIEQSAAYWRSAAASRQAYDQALQAAGTAEKHYASLCAIAKHADPPKFEDTLPLPMEETLLQIQQNEALLHHQNARLGEYRGRMEALGEEADLQRKLERVNQRIQRLKETYDAAVLGLQALEEASAELQRRYAPKITRQAQSYLRTMTAGRYDRMSLSQDFTLWTAAAQEDTLREALRRSDGTLDQLYLALRLAAADALAPEVPLVLDDALVRFDDTRLRAALSLLRTLSASRQILLFTCQARESRQ